MRSAVSIISRWIARNFRRIVSMRRFCSSRVIVSPRFLPGKFFLLAEISPAFKNLKSQDRAEIATEEMEDENI